MSQEQEISITGAPIKSGNGVPPQHRKTEQTPIVNAKLVEEAKNIENKDILDFIISKKPEDFLPWEKVTLPSMGYFYDGKIPGGVVEVRPMGLVTDKILATSRLAQSGQSIDYLYKNCVRFPTEFDPLDLLQGDRTFLLWYLRGITHGNVYEFTVTCSNESCKRASVHEYDLNKLAETVQSPKVTSEPIKIQLEHFSKLIGKDVWAEARFLRGRDLSIIIQSQQNKQRIQGGVARNAKTGAPMSEQSDSLDSSVEENLNLIIVSINGNKDRMKISNALTRMSSADTATIREVLRQNEPGIDTNILITCPDCQNEMKLSLPFTESFFRPTDSRRVRG